MKYNPNILIIGSTGRNTGKTEFACRIIKLQSKTFKIIGIKVTTFESDKLEYHKSSEESGCIDPLTGHYDITEEINGNSQKDTSRILMAGAQKSYWLRVKIDYIEEGIDSLLKLIPMDALIVCESNSLRRVIKPGLFIVIKNKNVSEIKPNCNAVIQFADKIIEFNNSEWDFTPDRILIENNRWIIK